MKKLFFFRSHSSSSTSNNQLSPPPIDKVEKSGKNKNNCEDPMFGSTPSLRRSLSFTSGSLYSSGKGPRNNGNQAGSHCSNEDYYYYSNKPSGRLSSRSRPQTPERLQTRSKCIDVAVAPNAQGANSDLSEGSLYCSSNVSNSVLDLYIDGEQEMDERCEKSKTNFPQFEKLPPRLQFATARDARQQKRKSQTFRGGKITPNDCNESPRELAKHVVERLSSQSQFSRSKEFDHRDGPITIDDVYGRTFNNGRSNVFTVEAYPKDWHPETSDGSPLHEESQGFLEKDAVMDPDLRLFRKFKEAEERAATLSQEFGKGNYLACGGYSVPELIHTIRSLTEEKVNMALEVSTVLEDRIAEKTLLKEKLRLARVELDAQTQKLGKEKNELQLTLEKELDRRSNEWSLKLEKLQAEEHRLRERVRELAEQNVGLQREVSCCSEREMDSRNRITLLEKQLEDLSVRFKEAGEENHYLQRSLSEIQEKARSAEEERDCTRRNLEDKVSECKDLHQSTIRLQRTCNEQEKTIDGLRGLCEESLGKRISESLDFGSAKLQFEHMRLTGVEHALRKEVESFRAEVDSLRRENIDLLNRLKKDGTFLTFKLDRELEGRVSGLENQLVPLLMESNQLGRKLMEFVKTNGHASALCLDGQALVEWEVKLQGLERTAKNVTGSLRTVSSVLQEKPTLLHEKYSSVYMDTQSASLGNEPYKCNDHNKSEDIVRASLKAETLLTSLLRDKLYSKELDLEQQQAELAAAVRGNDIINCQLQNALDNLSRLNHKMKELELQAMKKDEMINELGGDLQECKKELAIVRGILPKVSEERDMMWEEVKQFSEKNMLLNSEMNALRKKIEALEEEVLLKEGQITILKDSLGKPLGLLASPDSLDNLRWADKH